LRWYLLWTSELLKQKFYAAEVYELLTYYDEDNENDDYSENDASDWRHVWSFSQMTCLLGGLWSIVRQFATCQHYSTELS